MDRAALDVTGDDASTIQFVELPSENKVVTAHGLMGILRISKSDGVTYKGTPIHPVSVYPECLLSIEKVGRRYYYVVKTPLKGGYWKIK